VAHGEYREIASPNGSNEQFGLSIAGSMTSDAVTIAASHLRGTANTSMDTNRASEITYSRAKDAAAAGKVPNSRSMETPDARAVPLFNAMDAPHGPIGAPANRSTRRTPRQRPPRRGEHGFHVFRRHFNSAAGSLFPRVTKLHRTDATIGSIAASARNLTR
jgi:hypothetical protein